MATDKEYQALIDSLSGECERLHKENEELKALSQEPCEKCKYFDGNSCQHYDYKVGYTQGYEDASNRFRQEPCDDAISREELLKAISTWDKFGIDDTNSLFRLDNLSLPHYVPYIHYDDVIKCIKGMPSVTQKSGKWIEMDGYDGDVYYDCSECGESWTTIEGTPWDNGMKYCPNCGACMREGRTLDEFIEDNKESEEEQCGK